MLRFRSIYPAILTCCVVILWKVGIGTDHSASDPLCWTSKSLDASTDDGSMLNNPEWGQDLLAPGVVHGYLPLGLAKTTRN